MTEKGGKLSETRNKTVKNVLNKITPNDAYAIINILAREDKNIAERIVRIAMEYLSEVDIEEVASQVYSDLNIIDVEEVWDRSGNTRYGYFEPTEMAWEMFEEALGPFFKELRKYQELSMYAEAKRYCMGILKGIYRFEKESTSEYKDWATDAPAEYFGWVFDEWKEGEKDQKNINDVEEFKKKNFPDWR